MIFCKYDTMPYTTNYILTIKIFFTINQNCIFENHLRIAYFLTNATIVKTAVICKKPTISWFAIWSENIGSTKKFIGRYIKKPITISVTLSIIDFFFES